MFRMHCTEGRCLPKIVNAMQERQTETQEEKPDKPRQALAENNENRVIGE